MNNIVAETLDTRELRQSWHRAFDKVQAEVGATNETHRLVGHHGKGTLLYRAWYLPFVEAVTEEPKYPCVELRRLDDGIAIVINRGNAE